MKQIIKEFKDSDIEFPNEEQYTDNINLTYENNKLYLTFDILNHGEEIEGGTKLLLGSLEELCNLNRNLAGGMKKSKKKKKSNKKSKKSNKSKKKKK